MQIYAAGGFLLKGKAAMKQSKINILLYTFLMLLCVLSVPSEPVRASGEVTFEIGSANGSVGDEITIPISIRNSSEVATMDLTVVYDPEELSFVRAVKGSVVADGNICDINPVTEQSFIRFVFSSLQEIPEDGEVMQLKFVVLKDEPSKHTVDLDVRDVFNMEIEDLAWKTEGGREIAPGESGSEGDTLEEGSSEGKQSMSGRESAAELYSGNEDGPESVQGADASDNAEGSNRQNSESTSNTRGDNEYSGRRFIVKTEDGIKDVTDTAGRETGENLLADKNTAGERSDSLNAAALTVAGVLIVFLITGVIIYKVRKKKIKNA